MTPSSFGLFMKALDSEIATAREDAKKLGDSPATEGYLEGRLDGLVWVREYFLGPD